MSDTTSPRLRGDRGFSFIELLAYMAIAALLILAAIPQFNNYRGNARDATTMNDVNNAAVAVEAWLIGHPGETFPYVTNTWPGAGGAPALSSIGTVASDGTVILIADRYQLGTWGPTTAYTQLGQAFCVVAYNPDGRKYKGTGSTQRFSYHSGNGGMGVECTSK